MYYNNKTTFYVRQYGPMILIMLLSVLLIGSGVLIYLNGSASNQTPNETIIASNDLKDTDKTNLSINNNALLPVEFESLDILEKTSKIEIKSINESKQFVIFSKDKTFNTELIGIDFSKSSIEDINSIFQDLQNSNIEIAFDKVKNNKKVVFAYMYKDGTLYNEKILEEGKAILKEEKDNTSLLDNLRAAQAFAKQTRTGIWSKNSEY